MNIYNITQDLQRIFDELEENGGELTPELEEALVINEQNLKDKLDNYRKAYSLLNSEAKQCKEEEQRIANIRKVKENTANRLKSTMQFAVEQFGETGKNDNKVVNLIDSKLYTKTTKCTELNMNLAAILKDCFLDLYKNAYEQYLLDQGYDEIQKLTENELIDKINEKFIANYPESAKRLFEETGHYFTIYDLNIINLTISVTKPLSVFRLGHNKDLIEILFGHFNAECNIDLDKTFIKNRIENGDDISIGKIVKNKCLIIK